jgi:hypothetical protein
VLVVLILVAVGLGPVWGSRLDTAKAYAVTAAGWIAAMIIVVASGTVPDMDPGFWIFNTLLLAVAFGLAHLGGRRRARRIAESR